MSSLPVCFLKHPCKQCNFHLNISSISWETCYIFSRFNVIISKPVFFLTYIQFHTNHTPYYGVWFRITRHSNKTLLWCATTTHAVFSLMTGLICIFYLKKTTNKKKTRIKKAIKETKENRISGKSIKKINLLPPRWRLFS